MIPQSNKFIALNGHSIDSVFINSYAVGVWLFFLKIWLSCIGIKQKNIIFTFDDFYKKDIELIEILHKHKIENIIIFYCPGVFNLKKPSSIFTNDSLTDDHIATKSDISIIQKKFPFVKFGVHGYRHESYTKINKEKLEELVQKQVDCHIEIFGKNPAYFAFPYGRSNKISEIKMIQCFEAVFLSDNRKDITFYAPQGNRVINRRHLEIGGQLLKFIPITLIHAIKALRRGA